MNQNEDNGHRREHRLVTGLLQLLSGNVVNLSQQFGHFYRALLQSTKDWIADAVHIRADGGDQFGQTGQCLKLNSDGQF